MTQLALKRDWKAYYEAVNNRPPRKTLLTALAAFEKPGVAIDLGCGEGRDTGEILRQNWAVLAIDQNPDAIANLRKPSLDNIDRLATQIASFENLQLPQPVDLINASFSLPFCSNEDFPSLWIQILKSLATAVSRLICWIAKIDFSPLAPNLGGTINYLFYTITQCQASPDRK